MRIKRFNWFNSPTPFRVRKVRAARAVFQSEEIQRIDLDFEIEGGERIRFELLPKDAHALISQVSTAYNAIHPRLPNTNSAGFYGMGE